MRLLSKIEHWKLITFLLVFYDCVALAASYFFALWLRFDLSFQAIPTYYMKPFLEFLPFYLVITIIVFVQLHLYRSIWRFASYDELFRIIIGTFITFVLHILGMTLIIHQRMPISYYVFGIVLQFVFTIGIRFSYRFILLIRSRYFGNSEKGVKRVMLIGAGAAGTSLLRGMKRMNGKDVPCCFIDDNPNKWGRFIDGIKIEGGRDIIPRACEKYNIDKIYFVIPSISNAERKKILNICKETGCELRILPDIRKFTNGEVNVTDMKDVAVEDLLGRDQILVNMDDIFHQLEGKRILVTGGGGSIGSELCRQIAAHDPKQLIIFDVYENNAYEIQQELKKKYPKMDLQTIIGSVRDSRKVWKIFEDFHPEIVYHAAAHKHVPLMEDSPCESIKNNTIGTYKTAYAAMVFGTERFVLISTDKAVNPTNIMGASKRLCEMVVQAFDAKVKAGEAEQLPQLFTHWLRDRITGMAAPEILKNAKTEFVAVRFGNVLGSNGSVIPLFKKQIAAGGPVTVTHPDIIRYFMTIPEAVSLVLQAGTLAKGGEIFVLDMGEPVKIDTLARNLIKLSGLKPDVDIMIEYTGLRPGEKLYEEKLMAEEGLQKTDNELIHIGSPIPFDTDIFLHQLTQLMTRAYNNDSTIRDLVKEMVPTYIPA